MDDIEYQQPVDIQAFCRALQKAWNTMPEETFANMLSSVFYGYNLHELTGEEMKQMLDDFILQNE